MNEAVLILFAVAAAASVVWFLPRRAPGPRPAGSAPHEHWIPVESESPPVVMEIEAGQQLKLRLTRGAGSGGMEIRCDALGLARSLAAGTTTTVDLQPTATGIWPLTVDGRTVAILAVKGSDNSGGGLASAAASDAGRGTKAGA